MHVSNKAGQSQHELLELLFSGLPDSSGNIVLCDEANRVAGQFSPSQVDDIQALAEGNNSQYFRVCLMDDTVIGNKQGGKSTATTIVCLPLDVDCSKPGHVSRDDAFDVLTGMDDPPSIIVNSKGKDGGFHAYWLLDSPVTFSASQTVEDAQARLDGLADRVRTLLAKKPCTPDDKGNYIVLDAGQTLYRLMRPTGTTRDNGNSVSIEWQSDRAYNLSDFEPASVAEPTITTSQEPSLASVSDLSYSNGTETVDDFNSQWSSVEHIVAVMQSQGHQVWKAG
ncbi:MAG: hypothetical protein GY878_11520, partial [Fuerstiella sp.]|nr:hypothetical protein [Fuerstiella sp.]